LTTEDGNLVFSAAAEMAVAQLVLTPLRLSRLHAGQ